MITENYLDTVTQRLAEDIAEVYVNGEQVNIDAIDIDGHSVIVTTSQEFFDADISSRIIRDSDGMPIYSSDTTLSTTPNERISLSIRMNIEVAEGTEE